MEPTDGSGVADATVETLILGLDLAEDIVEKSPELFAHAILSVDVQNEIKRVLEKFVKDRVFLAPSAVSKKDAEDLQKALLGAAEKGIENNITHEIKNTAKYQALDGSLKKLSAALEKCPVGIWLDKHSKTIYIVGAVAILSGAAAMYVTKTGDKITNLVFPLNGGKSVKFQPIGGLHLEAGLEKLGFVPSKRLIETKTFLKADWNQIEVKLNLALTSADGTVSAAADGKVVVPVAKNVNLQFGGSLNSNKNYSLNATVSVNVHGTLQLGIMAGYGDGVNAPTFFGGSGASGPSGGAGSAISRPLESRPSGFVGLGISASF